MALTPKQGNHGANNERWTEEQQVYVLEHQFTMLNKVPQLRGVTPWIPHGLSLPHPQHPEAPGRL
jgi:beta-glucuronidase